MYRRINPGSARHLSMRMLFQPTADGLYLRACEADGWRGLVGALINDPSYEAASTEDRLVARLRLADEVRLLAGLGTGPVLEVSDHEGASAINVATDATLIRSLHRLGVVSLEPGLGDERADP